MLLAQKTPPHSHVVPSGYVRDPSCRAAKDRVLGISSSEGGIDSIAGIMMVRYDHDRCLFVGVSMEYHQLKVRALAAADSKKKRCDD